MKKLSDYIREISLPAADGYRTFEEFIDVNHISEEQINERIIDTYLKTSQSNVFRYNVREIFETLSKSHDHEKLIDRMCSVFKDEIHDVTIIRTKSSVKSFYFTVHGDDFDILMNDKFTHLIEFFNYTISEIKKYKNHGDDEYVVYVEPTYSEKVTDYVYDECDAKIYHVTRSSNYHRIMHRGLQMKPGDDYRVFVPRIYVSFGRDGDTIKNNVKHTIEQLRYDDYVILEIDLSHYDIDVYRDTSSDNEFDGYVYAYIPPKFIRRVDFDEL